MSDSTDGSVLVRRAVADAEVEMSQETLSAIVDGSISKGDVLSIAELAGVMAAKRAAELIPLMHPAGLTHLVVNASPDRGASAVRIHAETAAVSATGVEMEAMTAAAVAALTVYDMIREIEPGAVVRSVRLASSTGDQAEEWIRPAGQTDTPRPPKGVRVAGRITPSGLRGGSPYKPAPRKRFP